MSMYPLHEDPTALPHMNIDGGYILTACSPEVGADYTLWNLLHEPREPIAHLVFGGTGAISQLILCQTDCHGGHHTALALACAYSTSHVSTGYMSANEIWAALSLIFSLGWYDKLGNQSMINDLREAGVGVLRTRQLTLEHALTRVLERAQLNNVTFDIDFTRDPELDLPYYTVTFSSDDQPFTVWPGNNGHERDLSYSELVNQPSHNNSHQQHMVHGPDGALLRSGAVRAIYPPAGHALDYQGNKSWLHLDNPFVASGHVVKIKLSPIFALSGMGSMEISFMLRSLLGLTERTVVAVGDAFRAPLEYMMFAEHLKDVHGFDLPGSPLEQAHLLWAYGYAVDAGMLDQVCLPNMVKQGDWDAVLQHQYPALV